MRPTPSRMPEPPRQTSRSTHSGRPSAGLPARRAIGLGLLLAAAQLFTAPNIAASCLAATPTDEIAIALGGGRAASLRVFVSEREAENPELTTPMAPPMSPVAARDCFATIDVPLSAFPTSRLAMRPADVARSMRDLVEKHGIGTCEIAVFYENDTNEEIAEHELCLQETFAFGERKHWSLAREGLCWEPEPLELVGTGE